MMGVLHVFRDETERAELRAEAAIALGLHGKREIMRILAAELEIQATPNRLLGDREQAERDQKLASSLPPAYPGLEDPILQEVNQRELVARQSAERADRLAASGDMAAAARAFQQMIEDRPDLSRPRLNLATLMAMQGDMQNAAAIYRETIELFPNESLAYQFAHGFF